jgi:hypothetical protein
VLPSGSPIRGHRCLARGYVVRDLRRRARPAGGPVTIDGRLDEPAWALAVTGAEMTVLGTRAPAPRLTTFRFLYTDQALLVAVECQTISGGRRVMATPVVKEHDGPVFTDESVELYLQPQASGPYYHFAANALGVQYEAQGMDATWNGEWTARTAESDLGWQLEISIPYRTLGLTAPPRPGDNWRFNLCRNDRTYQKYWATIYLTDHGYSPLLTTAISSVVKP